MKRTSTPSNWLAAAITGLALAFGTGSGLAAPDRDLGTFDTGISGTGWLWGKGWGNSTIEWDGSQDNTGNGGGSLHAYGSFDRATSDTPLMLYGILSGNPWWHPDPAYDMTVYKSLEFDIKWDGSAGNMSLADFNSPLGGGVTGLEIHACPDGAGGPILATTNIPAAAASGWTHISIPINPALSGLSAVYGIWMNKWLASTTATGTFSFWIDNVLLKGGDVLPPPTVSLGNKPVPGLAFIAASSGTYDRQEIRTVGSNYAWYGASGPVSYSVDVAKIGENAPAPTGFTLFMHFVPGIPNPNDGGSDYGEPNVVMWTIGNSADGSAWSQLRYKTNAPGSNGNMFTDGLGGFPGGVWNPTPAGTWTITFSQDTNIVITAPTGGAITNILPPEVVDIFKNYSTNMQINVGGVPGNPSRLGQMAVVTRVKFTGTPGEPNVDSDFLTQSRDTNVWRIVASSPVGVQQIPTNAAYWINWTLPANGFSLETKATLGPGFWNSPAITGWDASGFHQGLLLSSDLPGTNSGYFRLIKRAATQLQVLLPGETNAPNTTTGKIGTLLPQMTGFPFDVTVNACDATWHIVPSCSDTVGLTSTDTTAGLPNNAPLVNGTVTFVGTSFNYFYFGSTGTWTITASDVTTNAIANGVSAPITITQ
jgi:hypothetical protein